MAPASVLNWVIYALVVMGVIQVIYVAYEQRDADSKKIEMKQKLDSILLQLNGQIKNFNSSVSTLQDNQLKSSVFLRKEVPTARIVKRDSSIPKRTVSDSLFSPSVSLPKPAKVKAQRVPSSDTNIGTGGAGTAANGGSSVPVTPVSASVSSSTSASGRKSKRKTALLFTMDSISSYEANSKRGGAAGELLIRHSLEHAFSVLGVELHVMSSDAAFLKAKGDQYDIIIVDPWTWAGKGWVPKPVLRGQLDKVYVLDFFGSERLPKEKPSFKVPAKCFLTAFGYPGNQFLGYFMDEAVFAQHHSATRSKKQQGVIWGKDPNHFSRGRDQMLQRVAEGGVMLHSTASRPVFKHRNVIWHGHQNRDGWLHLLAESKFLLGLGDPLLGPSAIDAVSMGCMYINPVHDTPVRGHFQTQHDYAMEQIGAPYVCNSHLSDVSSVQKCIALALKADLPPFIPPDFQHDAYVGRVKTIFGLA